MGVRRTALMGLGLVAAALAMWPAPAGADVVTPPGSCTGEGTWVGSGQHEVSTDHSPGDVIEIPQKDTVDWVGALDSKKPGEEVPRRDIDGAVELALPKPFGWVTIDSWGGSSVKAANTGSKDYDLPSALIGIELTLRGHHSESGLSCEGEVKLKVDESALKNPLAVGGLVGVAVFGALLGFAARAKAAA